MSSADLTRYVRAAEEAARAAGALLRKHAGHPRRVATKRSPIDLVTEVDRASERLIAKILRSTDPDIGLLGEEQGERRGRRPLRWVVDPLDGTINFVHGLPLFGVSIALQALHVSAHSPQAARQLLGSSAGGVPPTADELSSRRANDGSHSATMLVGVIYDPMREELFSSAQGRGAFLNGRRIQVSPTRTLSQSLLSTGFPASFRTRSQPYLGWFEALQRASRGVRRLGTSVISLASVAAGRMEAFYERELWPWDIAAGILLVQEAGGRITDVAGRPLTSLEDGRLVASNGRIHRALVRALTRPSR